MMPRKSFSPELLNLRGHLRSNQGDKEKRELISMWRSRWRNR